MEVLLCGLFVALLVTHHPSKIVAAWILEARLNHLGERAVRGFPLTRIVRMQTLTVTLVQLIRLDLCSSSGGTQQSHACHHHGGSNPGHWEILLTEREKSHQPSR